MSDSGGMLAVGEPWAIALFPREPAAFLPSRPQAFGLEGGKAHRPRPAGRRLLGPFLKGTAPATTWALS